MSAADAVPSSGAAERSPELGLHWRRRRAALSIGLAALLLLAACLSALALGPITFSVPEILAAVLGSSAGAPAGRVGAGMVVMEIRLPRVVLGALVGAATASAGAVMQGVFRNPLADPGLVGVSSGAALAAVAWIVLGGAVVAQLPVPVQRFALPLAAFAGGLLTTLLLERIARRGRSLAVATLLLAGVAMGALSGAMTGLLIFLADDQQLRQFTFWSLGSLGGASWAKVAVLLPFVMVILAALPFLARGLDAISLGESVAFHIGIDVERLKKTAVLVVAGAVGASVAVSGVIGFIGLVTPHLVRLAIGPAHRALLPASALLGAALVVGADTVARTIVSPAELPLGVVTAAVGAPFFLWLLLRDRAALAG